MIPKLDKLRIIKDEDNPSWWVVDDYEFWDGPYDSHDEAKQELSLIYRAYGTDT